jgi:hypothetical protein
VDYGEDNPVRIPSARPLSEAESCCCFWVDPQFSQNKIRICEEEVQVAYQAVVLWDNDDNAVLIKIRVKTMFQSVNW